MSDAPSQPHSQADHDELAGVLASLARHLPSDLLGQLLARLEASPVPGAHDIEALAVTTQARARLGQLNRAWNRQETPAAAIALGLRTAVATQEWAARHNSTELVWTGPTSLQTDWRRTEQVLLHLIDAAEHTLWLVTFAAYSVPAVAEALAPAAARGVRINFVAESAEASAGKIALDAFAAIGGDLPQQTHTYIWPREKRPTDSEGHFGALHAKCAVADNKMALISSANLTGHALHLNMEMGVLLHGDMAAHIAAMLRDQVQNGLFVRLIN